MKYLVWLAFWGMGCGSNDGAPDVYPWNVAEEPVSTEFWYDVSMSDEASPHPASSTRCSAYPFYASVNTSYNAKWLSIGGRFAQPARRWFRCDRSSSHYKIDDDFQIICGYNSVRIFARDETTVTKLPKWLETQIDWEMAFNTRGQSRAPSVASFTLPVRTYDPDTGKIVEYSEMFRVFPNRFYTETAQPNGPVCLAEMSGIRMGVVDLTEQCGTDTNCVVTY